MAARYTDPRKKSNDRARGTQLMNRLYNHAVDNLEKPMDQTQIRAAEVWLKKNIPDLSAVEHSGQVSIAEEATKALRRLNGNADGTFEHGFDVSPGIDEADSEMENEPDPIRN